MTSVLIVDDDDQIRRSLSRLLTSNELQCRVASALDDAAEAVRSDMPDVVLLDVTLGHTSGLGLLKELRQNDARRPGIVMMTGRRDLFPEISTTLGPADDWITKPWDADELIARLYLSARRARL
ncbi:MAG TPA: response regulator [Candidatus Limnocylindria bacterium]